MDQKGKTLRDEVHEVVSVPETANGEDGWLSTNHEIETVSEFEMFAEQFRRTTDDPHRWKWAIIALHSGLQGMMVLALKGSHGSNVLRELNRIRWLEWFCCCRRRKYRKSSSSLAPFLDLYRKIKGREMEMYCGSQRFVPMGTQGRSVKDLNRLRNEFIHFTPKHWLLETAGLPKIALDCLKIAEFLAWESGNVLWHKPDLHDRLDSAFKSAHNSL